MSDPSADRYAALAHPVGPPAVPGYVPFRPVSRRTSRIVTWSVVGVLVVVVTGGVFLFEAAHGLVTDALSRASSLTAPADATADDQAAGDDGYWYEADGFRVSFYDEPEVDSVPLTVGGKERETTEAYYWDDVGEDVQYVPLTPKELKLSERARLTAVYDAAVEQWEGNPIRSAYTTVADEPALAGTVVTEDDTFIFTVVLHGKAAYILIDDAWPEEHRYFVKSFSFTG